MKAWAFLFTSIAVKGQSTMRRIFPLVSALMLLLVL